MRRLLIGIIVMVGFLYSDIPGNQIVIDTVGSGSYQSVAAFDIDNDGNLELIASTDSGYLKIYKKQAENWTLYDQLHFSEVPRSILYADLDNDGHKELIVGTGNSDYGGHIYIGEYQHGGTFNLEWESNTIYSIRFSQELSVGDFDNDGSLELAVGVAWYGRYLSVFKYSAGSYHQIFRDNINSDCNATRIEDINGDGDKELIVATSCYDDYSLRIYKQDSLCSRYATGLDNKSIDLIDVDNDGIKEIVMGINSTCGDVYHQQPKIMIFKYSNDSLNVLLSHEIQGFDGLHGFSHLLTTGELKIQGLMRKVICSTIDYGAGSESINSIVLNEIDSDSLIELYRKDYDPDTFSFWGRAPIIADVDNDGNNEVVVPTQSGVFVYNISENFTTQDTMRVASNWGVPGGIIRIPVTLSHQHAVSGIQTTILFDSNLLHFQNVVLDSQLANFSISHNSFTDSVRVVIVSVSGDSILPGVDTLFYISFTIDSNATLGDSTYLNLNGAILADPSGNHLPVEAYGNWIFIRGTRGDLNQDGVVDVADVVLEINIILGRSPAPTPYEEWAGDMDNNGVIDVADVVRTINVILGRGKGNPEEGEAYVWINDGKLFSESGCDIAGIQLDLIGNVYDITIGRDVNSSNLKMFSNTIPGGYRILIIGLDGSSLPPGRWEILRFKGKGSVKNLALVNKNGRRINVHNDTGIPRLKVTSITPNPVVKSGYIKFMIPQKSNIIIKIYDATGRMIKELVNKEYTPGLHVIKFDAKGLHSGVYFVEIRSNIGKYTKKFAVK